jgi:AcrR family transcriptional regulator
MGRPRRQEPRRAHLIAATQRVLARDGLVGLRVREIAAEAGVSPASVLYYFPDSYQLAVQALDQAAHRWATERAATAASVPDPVQRVAAMVTMEIPDALPGMARAFCEIPGQLREHPELAVPLTFLIEDQVAVLTAAIEDGVASGAFLPIADLDRLARTSVALLHACINYQAWGVQTAAQGRSLVFAHLEGALGCTLSASSSTAPATGRSYRRPGPDRSGGGLFAEPVARRSDELLQG